MMDVHSPALEEEDTPSLALLGHEIATIVHKVEEEGGDSPSEFTPAAWKHELERFSLWADNLGLYHRGHSSLDYRLREADALRIFVRKLLSDLSSSLGECML